jgi:hypothetical protein
MEAKQMVNNSTHHQQEPEKDEALNQQLPSYRPAKPFSASFEGYTATAADWPNTVTVESVTGYDPTHAETDEGETYADANGNCELVEIDTNYKASRPGEYPVRLTRGDAINLAGAVLRATEDTFHFTRCGQLRPTEAAELLRALEDVEHQLADLRAHALSDLLADADVAAEAVGTQVEQQAAAEPVAAWRGSWPTASSVSTFDELLATALAELFPTTASAIEESAAFGALTYKINRRCRETGETPHQVLSAVDSDDRTFTPSAADPAAFLASRVDL